MAAVTASVVGGGLAYLGAKEQSDALDNAVAAASTTFYSPNFNAAGGQVAGLNADTNNLFFGLGDLESSRAGLVDLSDQSIQTALQGGLPSSLQNAANVSSQFNSQGFVDPSQSGLNFLEQLVGGQLGQTGNQFNNLLASGFQTGLQNSAFNASQSALADASVTGQQARDQSLELLRAQALPDQQRAVNSTLDNLFAGGRLGTTGGAQVIGELSEAQNQQDLAFQQAALEEGRLAQNQAAGLATQFGALGQSTASLGDNLLQSAFNRFNTTLGVGSDLNNQRFSRGLSQFSTNQGALQQNLSNEALLAELSRSLQSQDLGLATNALTAQGGLNQQGLNNLATTLNFGNAQVNARLGSGTNIAALASNPNFGSSPLSAIGGALGTAFGGGGSSGGLIDILGGLLGG